MVDFGRKPEPLYCWGSGTALYCIGCCWALMLLLFVGGVMNIAWIAAIAALVLAEKLWARGLLLSRMVGVAAVAGGLLLIARYLGVW